MTKEETHSTSESRNSRRSKMTKGERKKSGYTNITELTFGKSLENTTTTINNGYSTYVDETEFDRINNGPSIGLQTINGYQFSPYISAGLGLGINTDEKNTYYTKSGDSMGQSSIICYNRAKNWGIIILLDQRNSKMRQNLLNVIYDTILQ